MIRAIEALGPEQLVHVEIVGKPVLAEDVLEGLVDGESAGDLAEIKSDEGDRMIVVARLDAGAQVRQDEPIELSVDLRKLHFFDLESGSSISA